MPGNTTSPSYLGAPIETSKSGYDFLIQKFERRLHSWKSALLTPAGRLILIKAVLQALPVYYMATSLVPKSVLKQITGMICRFFWGKADKQRYMAYVAWEKITLPLGMGGLGVRDLADVNSALLMKQLWKLAQESQALWVRIVQAKYLPRSELWLSKRLTNCLAFWKGVLQ